MRAKYKFLSLFDFKRGDAPVITGLMSAHLYPPTELHAVPREFTLRDQNARAAAEAESSRRRSLSPSGYMGVCETTTLIVAAKQKDIMR